ncbi:nucleic acid/nucleotide deaminase domain-containing protein [Kitasatospora sp. NPDC004240]
MTNPTDRIVQRFGGTGVRIFDTVPGNPEAPEAAALNRVQGLVLPLDVLPYFHTRPDEADTLYGYAREDGHTLDQADHLTWARLGSDRAFELCATPEGEVRALMLGYEEPERYVNSRPEALAECLFHLDVLMEEIGAAEDPDQAAHAFRYAEQAMRDADPAAFADADRWWPVVLEDIRTTASTEMYATFEFVSPDGEKHLVTEAGTICVHPEQRVWAKLYAAGVEPDQVTRIHTELEACFLPGHYCSFWLSGMFPDAEVSHLVPAGENAAERAENLHRLREITAGDPGRD